jgi:[ribosomal protein S5]-alanine N-acetyltransferase
MEFTLRQWQNTDLTCLVKYANNKAIAQNLTNQFPHPYTEEAGKRFIEMATKNTPPNIMAIVINNEACGGIGVHVQEDVACKNAEMGYWLAEPFWGKGIITKAIVQMVDYGFANFDITRIFARPFGRNIASQKALEKSGFILEASFKDTMYKDGQFEDELIYAIRKSSI